MKLRFYAVLIGLLGALQGACNGNDCAALTSGLTDGDSDCIIDTGDNCPGIANFDQVDIDGDEVGAACDSNDSNEDVASINADPNAAAVDLSGMYALQTTTCSLTDETLEISQTNSEISVIGDRNGGYDAALTSGDDGVTHLTLQQGSQSCDAQISGNTTLSFYCHDEADARSDGCANIFDRI